MFTDYLVIIVIGELHWTTPLVNSPNHFLHHWLTIPYYFLVKSPSLFPESSHDPWGRSSNSSTPSGAFPCQAVARNEGTLQDGHQIPDLGVLALMSEDGTIESTTQVERDEHILCIYLILYIYACIYVYIYIFIHTLNLYIHMYTYIYIHTYIISIYIYVYTYVYIYIYIHQICIYKHIYIYAEKSQRVKLEIKLIGCSPESLQIA